MSNWVHEDISLKDTELFFGDDEPCNTISRGVTNLLGIVCLVNPKMSRKAARAAGWDRPIPEGFAEHRVGKKMFWTLMPWSGM